MCDVLTVETKTLDILTDYFTGRYTAYLDYIKSSDEPITDKKRFALEVMNTLDPVVSQIETELLSIYVDKYRTHKPFTYYVHNASQRLAINLLNKKLSERVKDIQRPQISFVIKQ